MIDDNQMSTHFILIDESHILHKIMNLDMEIENDGKFVMTIANRMQKTKQINK